MKRPNRQARAYLLAVVADRVCGTCELHPAFMHTLTCLGCWRKADEDERRHCDGRRSNTK